MPSLDELLGTIEPFLDKVTGFVLSNTTIPLRELEIDHICYRCSSTQEYKSVVKELLENHEGNLLVEGLIGGRPIATIELARPICYKGWNIPLVEVPCPKPGRVYASGLEHIEVVVGNSGSNPHNSKEDLEIFVANHKEVSFDTRAIDKQINADVCLKVDEHSSVKFHLCSLREVCRLENEMGIVDKVPSTYWD